MNALLFITISTPTDPSREAVRNFLSLYLGDPYVISIPQPWRRRLVDGKIIPKRIAESQERYRRLWTLYHGEMPLRRFTRELMDKMNARYTDDVAFAMSFYADSEAPLQVIQEMKAHGDFESITLLPLYPQQTFSSYASLMHKARALVRKHFPATTLYEVSPFYRHPRYIDLLAERVRKCDPQSCDRLLVSFHSIPVLHQLAGRLVGFNYERQCARTAKLLAERLSMTDKTLCCFQSAMGRKWLRPFIEAFAPTLPDAGIKRLIVVAPGFLTDCLETVFDIGQTLSREFLDAGGESFEIVPSLNADDDAVDFYHQLAEETRNA